MHKFMEVASGEKEISCQFPHFVRMIKSYEVVNKRNLHAEHKQMHKFTKVEVEKEKNKFHVTHDTSCQKYKVMKRNLHAEHKQIHKFKKYQVKRKIISCH